MKRNELIGVPRSSRWRRAKWWVVKAWRNLFAGVLFLLVVSVCLAAEAVKAIPTPVYSATMVYSSAKDVLTATATYRPSNLPADSIIRWYLGGTTPLLVVSQGGELYFVPWVPPGPGPVPPPPPPPPPEKLSAIIVEESAERTPAQATVLASPKVRALFGERDFRTYDAWKEDGTVKDDVAADLLPYVKRVKEAGLKVPVLFLVGPTGTVYSEATLPDSVAAFESLVKKFTKGGGK